MCDPVSMLIGAASATVATKVLAPKSSGGSAPAAADASAERAKAEAEAAASANQKLAADQRRRREQQSLVARGAPSLGDQVATNDSPLSAVRRIAGSLRRPDGFKPDIVSLMGRGADQGVPGSSPSPQAPRRKTIQPVAPGY